MELNNIPSRLKISNRKIVYEIISKCNGLSRAEISRMTGISGATIVKIIDYFVSTGVCEEQGIDSTVTSVGRKPISLNFKPNFAYLLTVAIEGNYADVGLLNMGHELIHVEHYKVKDFCNFLEYEIIGIIENILIKMNIQKEKLIAIGIGLPAIVDNLKTEILVAPLININQGWKLSKVIQKLKSELEVEVFVENDVNASAYGEYMKNYSNESKDLLYISVGTGVGSGIVLDGKVRRGPNQSAGEIGYLIFDKEYVAKANDAGWLEKKINLEALKEEFNGSIEFFLDENSKREIIDYLASYISLSIVNIKAILDINHIVLGGILVDHLGDKLIKEIEKKYTILTSYEQQVKRTKCKNSNLIGLSYIASENILGKILEEE